MVKSEVEILKTKSHWKKAYFYLWDEARTSNSTDKSVIFIPRIEIPVLLSGAFEITRFNGNLLERMFPST